MLVVKAADLDIHQFRQFFGQIFDVNARAAVNVRGVFVGNKHNFHRKKPP